MISLRVHVARKPDFVTSEQQKCRTEYASAHSDHRLYFCCYLLTCETTRPNNAAFSQGLHCSCTLLEKFNILSDDQTAKVV